jgi:hypothetical protein
MPPENEPAITEPEETVTVEPGGDDDPAPAKGAAPISDEERQSRRERREAYQRATERAEQAERQTAELRQQMQDLGRQHAEMRGYLTRQQQEQQQGDPRAAVTSRIESLENEADDLLNQASMAARAKDPENAKRLMRAYNAKLREAGEIAAEARLMPQFQQAIQEIRQSIPNTQLLNARDNLAREFPWLHSDEGARDMIDGEIDRMAAQNGGNLTFEIVRAATAKIGKRLGLGGREAPSEESRQRYRAVGGGEGSGGGESPTTVKMGFREKKLAEAAYRNLEAKDAHKQWAKDRASEARSGRG